MENIKNSQLAKKCEGIAFIGSSTQLAAAISLFLTSMWLHSKSLSYLAVYSAAGCAVWLLTIVHLRQKRLSYEELIETEDNNENPMFNEDDGSIFSSSRKLKQMEKWVLPISVSVLSIALIILGYVFLRKTAVCGELLIAANLSKSTVALVLTTFFVFIIGRFTSGMSTVKGDAHLLKGASGYLLSCALISFLCIIAFVMQYFGYSWGTKSTAYIIPVLMIIAGMDFLSHILLDIYRPRLTGQIERPPYQSFLIGLLAEPQGILKATAHSLDYQFGFKISDTWFYKFLEKIIAPLILFQLLILYLLSTIVIIHPYENGILERFGVPLKNNGILYPGIHFKYPWPIDKINIVSAKRIESIFINPHYKHEGTILWTVSHHSNRNLFLLPSKEETENQSDDNTLTGIPVNILMASAQIQYRVTDPFSYIYHQKNPKKLIKNIAIREFIRYTSTTDVFDFMGANLITVSSLLKTNIQAELNKLNVGVEIFFIGLYGIHPPVEVAQAFESVMESREEKQAKILKAETFANKILPKARAKGKTILIDAKSYADQQKLLSKSESINFENQKYAFSIAPTTYFWRNYLKTIKNALLNTRKIIISAKLKNKQIHIINLKTKIKPDLLDMNISRD
ncbi:protease modulator HflK [bacterium]|nr:protease modulator HflK [bacterium]